MQPKRKKGGQKGNKNALKHGYYSKIFNDKEQVKEFCSAADVRGIDEEIALIRHVIKCAARSHDEKYLSIIIRATNALTRLVRTRQVVFSQTDKFADAVQNVITDILIPLGVVAGPTGFRSIAPVNEGTNNRANEAKFTENK